MKVCVCGYGVVGAGVVEILDAHDPFKVKYIYTREPLDDIRYTQDFDAVLNDKSVNIVVEAMGGLEPAFSMLKNAIKEGKHIVTSNKELVEKHGAILHQLAKEYGVSFLFEGSVGGGIPLISTMRHGLYHEKITSVEAILNGTSNYILTAMREKKLEFETALKEAQDLGFAEKDPSDDIKAYDTARKIAIIGSILSGKRVDFNEIYTLGIEHITQDLIQYAQNKNQKIKLIAKLKMQEEGLEVSVMPRLISTNHPLYHVEGVNNAVLFNGKDVGEVLIQGAGAGRYPTASAIVSDVQALELMLPEISWNNEHARIIHKNITVLDTQDFKEKKVQDIDHQNILSLECEYL